MKLLKRTGEARGRSARALRPSSISPRPAGITRSFCGRPVQASTMPILLGVIILHLSEVYAGRINTVP